MRAVRGCKWLLAITLGSQLAGCEIFREPTPKASAEISKSGGNAANAPSSSNTLDWKKQTLAGVTFEAPFELVRSQEEAEHIVRLTGGEMTECEAYVYQATLEGSKSLKIVLSRAKGPAYMAANMEGAARQANRNLLARMNDPNGREEVRKAEFGGVTGIISQTEFRTTSGVDGGSMSLMAHAEGWYWQVMMLHQDREMVEIAKRIVASITIQP